jgi:D-inositol-3-phosphate glycosyltransferase
MPVNRVAMISVHASPLAPLGGRKAGGMNVYIRELAQEMGRRGVQVDIFTRRSQPDQPEVDERLGPNVRVIYLAAGPLSPLQPEAIYPFLSQFTMRLMSYATLHNLRYDIIYSHYWLSGWVAYKLKEAWGTPFVQMFHTLGHMKERIQRAAALDNDNLRIRVETEIVEWADAVVAATPAEESQLLWLYRSRARKIVIIPPGVNVERFHTLPANANPSRGADRHHMLLFVGRIEPLKAVDTILEALRILRQNCQPVYEQVHLMIVGGDPASDPEIAELRQLAQRLGVEEAVTFAGAREQAELPALYRAASAVIMPSDYESFGMVALEAMASGTPVIASAVGGLAYLVRDGVTGFHVPARHPRLLAEKIAALLRDDHQRRIMSANAALVAREYAWPAVTDQIMRLFEDVAARRARQRA